MKASYVILIEGRASSWIKRLQNCLQPLYSSAISPNLRLSTAEWCSWKLFCRQKLPQQKKSTNPCWLCSLTSCPFWNLIFCEIMYLKSWLEVNDYMFFLFLKHFQMILQQHCRRHWLETSTVNQLIQCSIYAIVQFLWSWWMIKARLWPMKSDIWKYCTFE